MQDRQHNYSVSIASQVMSLLNYGFTPISKTATTTETSELPEGDDLDGLSDADSSDIDSVVPEAETDSETQSAITGGLSS